MLLQGRDVRTLGAKSRELRALFQKCAPGLEVLGPAFAPVARVRDISRVQFILKAADRETIDRALRESLPKIRLKKTIVFSYSPFRERGLPKKGALPKEEPLVECGSGFTS